MADEVQSSPHDRPHDQDGSDQGKRSTDHGESSIETTDTKIPPDRSRAQTIILMLALCMAVFLAALDAVIITTALPTIAQEVGASDSGFAWIGAAYLLANAASVMFWGKVSDVFGRKPILVITNVVFMAGSLISALARTLTMLVAGRVVQGLGGGGLMALVNITIGDLFSPRERGMYFGMVGAVWGLASGIGPLIGGGLTENVSWRWCFWINLPISGVSLLILVYSLRIHTPKTPLLKGLMAIDWLGTLTFTGATLMLLLGLQFGGLRNPWDSPTVICLIVFGCITYIVFTLVERFAKYPLMPGSLFHDTSVVFCYVANFCHGLGFAAIAFFLPLYFQTVLGASPIRSGVWLLATALPLAVCTIGVGVMIKKTGRYNEIIRVSTALTSIAFGLLVTLPPRRDWPRLVLFQILGALGIAPNLQALLIALQALVRPMDVAAATATFAFVRHVGLGVGVVAGQVIFQSVMGRHESVLLDAGIPEDIAESFGSGSTIAAHEMMEGLSVEQREVARAVVTDGISKLWIFFCVASGVGLVSTFFIRQVELSRVHMETKTGLEAEEARVVEDRRARESERDGEV
ncbi:MFS drug transporter [Colletotrichum tofieldiae]|uniref:MFS drug transporter n=1 Tax=Colletotrichum tofieldiae TaxID=708197 RepID=A0A166VL46_9PEZI|nr:MFS drug transporter [Colletotrichum tofieldiae]GKT91160.1 MFS drug transporter [Colletotrichum tofieldiae]